LPLYTKEISVMMCKGVQIFVRLLQASYISHELLCLGGSVNSSKFTVFFNYGSEDPVFWDDTVLLSK
jgi:hypothetical protein